MSDREVRERRIAAVRLSFAAVCEFERHARRTDNLVILSTVIALTLLSFFTTHGHTVNAVAIGLAYTLGVSAGGVLAFKKVRRREWRKLKSMYDEIELQNMIIEESEGDDA